MFHFTTLFLTFMIYSILGWLFETVYCSIVHFSWDNRGMLNGPYCPIYGFGAIIAIHICQYFSSPVIIFIVCAAGSAFIEYFTSFLTEKLFHAVWWDYSYLPLNINGRICLSVTLGFGLGGLIVTYFLEPVVSSLLLPVSQTIQEAAALLFMAVFAADLALTLDALTSLNQKLAALEDSINSSIAERYDTFMEHTKQTLNSSIETVKEKISLEEFKEKFTMDTLADTLPFLNMPQKHIMKSFRGFRKVKYMELGQKLKQAVINRKKDTPEK